MRAVNERLGYEYRDVAITMAATLPLEPGRVTMVAPLRWSGP